MIIKNDFSWSYTFKQIKIEETGFLTVTDTGSIKHLVRIKKVDSMKVYFVENEDQALCGPQPEADVLSVDLQKSEGTEELTLKIDWKVYGQRTIAWKVSGRKP